MNAGINKGADRMAEIEAVTHLSVRTIADADRLMEQVRVSAARVHDWIAVQTGDPLDMLRRMKIRACRVPPG